MPVFELEDSTWGRQDWSLLKNGPVHLFWRPEVLEDTVTWLRSQEYSILSIDATNWADEDDMHTDLARSFGFPNYYGNNLNALNDCLGDVAAYEYGALRDSAGTALVLNHFDSFARSHREVAESLLDIFARAASTAMLFGHRMLCLVQSDDPQIEFEPVGASPVTWNPQEWQRAARTL